MSRKSNNKRRDNIELSDWFDQQRDNQQLQDILNQVEVSDEISDIANELKPTIIFEINQRIDRHYRRMRLYKTFAIAAACISALVISSVFLMENMPKLSDKELLMSKMESASSEVNEVSIIAGSTQKRVENEELITQTKGGEIIVGTKEEITSEEIQTEYVTVIVPKGKRSSVLFSDGSKVWVNSGTKLVYPKFFDEKTRNILVDGEIFLEVARNDKKPFIVHTKEMDICVLGTKFNVNAYSNESQSSVVLAEGSVKVSSGVYDKELIPGQAFLTENGTSVIEKVDVYSYICWKEGRLQLADEPFDVLLKRLSRYYGVEIVVDEKLNHYKFDGNLNLKDSLDDILNSLSLSKPFNITKKGNTIYLN